ncbi:MAG: PatB family C-S lyase [Gammaproteobacteria bacterium SHHR-1]|uniref:MalY/PatB family protein n=1 Tax=Magnetovirga frankeli TaxID=947516 RepID=UPI001293E1F9|nr:PatB family C-S lyase [gamma proteobacterium SS-5]
MKPECPPLPPSPFDREIERAATDSLKYDLRPQLFGRADVLPLWVADMDFATPDFIIQDLEQRLRHPILGYSLRPQVMTEILQAWLERRQGWRPAAEHCLFSPGVVPSLALAVRAFSRPGDGVLVQPPVYPPFFSCVQDNGRRLLRNPLILKDNQFQMDLEGLERLLQQEAPALLLLCSPHNPGGRVWRRQELSELIALCQRHGCLIVSDEIHADLLYPGECFTPAAALSERVVCLTSPGKAFNIAGITPSVSLIADAGLRQTFQQEQQAAHLTDARLLGDIALCAAYQEGDAWLDQLMAYLQHSRDQALAYARQHWPGIRVMSPQASFLFWLDCRELAAERGLTDTALNRLFIDQAGLGLSAGHSFGTEGSGFMRLNFGLPRKPLLAALERIARLH